MFKVPYTIEMVQQARKEAIELGALNNSILKGAGNVAGFLGEIALASFLNADRISNKEGKEKYSHDILWNGKRCEVKTKRRLKPPLPDYDVSIAATSLHQRSLVEKYLFVSLELESSRYDSNIGGKVYKGLKEIWFLGHKTAEEYFKLATFYPKGQVTGSNNFRTVRDMYNLEIKKLDVDRC